MQTPLVPPLLSLSPHTAAPALPPLHMLTPDGAVIRQLGLGHQVEVPLAEVDALGRDGVLADLAGTIPAAAAAAALLALPLSEAGGGRGGKRSVGGRRPADMMFRVYHGQRRHALATCAALSACMHTRMVLNSVSRVYKTLPRIALSALLSMRFLNYMHPDSHTCCFCGLVGVVVGDEASAEAVTMQAPRLECIIAGLNADRAAARRHRADGVVS